MWISHRKDSKADVSSVSPSSSLRRRANARNVSFRISLRWLIHIINPVDKTPLSRYTSHRSSTTVSLETYPSIHFHWSTQPRSQGPLSTSRKYPGCGWSHVYVYKWTPHRGWIFDLILLTLSMEVKVALLLYLELFQRSCLTGVSVRSI